MTVTAEKVDAPEFDPGKLTFQEAVKRHPTWFEALKYHVLKEHNKKKGVDAPRKATIERLSITEGRAKYFDTMGNAKDRHKGFQQFLAAHREGPEAAKIIDQHASNDGGAMV